MEGALARRREKARAEEQIRRERRTRASRQSGARPAPPSSSRHWCRPSGLTPDQLPGARGNVSGAIMTTC